MIERPFIWHTAKFKPGTKFAKPWAVTLGRPANINDYEASFETPAQAMNHALTLVPGEVPLKSTRAS